MTEVKRVRTLCGFTSRCMIPWEWQKSNACKRSQRRSQPKLTRGNLGANYTHTTCLDNNKWQVPCAIAQAELHTFSSS